MDDMDRAVRDIKSSHEAAIGALQAEVAGLKDRLARAHFSLSLNSESPCPVRSFSPLGRSGSSFSDKNWASSSLVSLTDPAQQCSISTPS